MSLPRCFRFLLILTAFAASGLLFARAEDFTLPSPQTKAEKHLLIERETFGLINDYRHAHDLDPLVWNDTIAETARDHSRDMAEGRVDFGHEGFHERVDRLIQMFAGLRGAGENVLFTEDPHEVARSAVTLWLHSPPHLHNIRGDFNYSGIGVWESAEGAIYFTQIFVKLAPSATAADP